MKNPILIFLTFIALSAQHGIAQPAASSDTYYRQGVAAEKAGDPDAAREAYQQSLRLNPRNADARFRLGQLKLRRDTIVRQGREATFSGVRLPQVLLDEAEFRESLEALAKMIETQSEGRVAPSFIVQDPSGKLAEARISLQLRNVTATAALDYILGMAGARARHDEFAIVITPK